MKIIKFKSQVQVADGRYLQIRKAISIIIKIQSLTWRLTFLIIPDLSCPFILGNSSLRHMQAVLDFNKKVLKFPLKNTVVPLSFSSVDINSISLLLEQPFKLNIEQEEEINRLKRSYQDVLTDRIGHTDLYTLDIRLKDRTPIRRAPYTLNPTKAQHMSDHINKLINKGIIEKCISPYASPAFLINKKDGTPRLCVDYRQLNKKIVFDAFPSPKTEDIFMTLHGSTVFSSIDLTSAFYQIPLAERSKNITAFVTPHGQYRFTHVPFGLAVSPSSLNRIVADLFGDLRYKFVLPYFDDLLIYSSNIEEHIKHLSIVLDRLRNAGLTANPEKSIFAMSRLRFLGHIISSEGVHVDLEKVQAIQKLEPPKNIKQLRSFLGMTSFFSKFIPEYARIAAPLNNLKRKGVKFKFNDEQLSAFKELKEKLTIAPVLRYPNFDNRFVLRTDASDTALGAVLLQQFDDGLHAIQYASRKLLPVEQRYTTYEKEALAMMFGLRKFQDYLLGHKFTLQVDNAALSWLSSNQRQMGKVGRWILELSKFDFDIIHIGGAINSVADALSRLYDDENKDLDNDNNHPTNDCLNMLNNVPQSFVSIKQHQEHDPFCRGIRQRIRSGEDVNDFGIRDGVLMKRVGKNRLWRIYVPLPIRKMVTYYHHDVDMSAHPGITKTYRDIARRFWWNGLYEDIRNYVKSCELCQRCKASNQHRGAPMFAEPPTAVWEKVYIDHIGPLSLTPNRNRYALVLVDAFSKWVEIMPTLRATSDATIKKLESLWCRYGPPNAIVSDNARCFTSSTFKSHCLKFGIKRINTTPYHPAANASERVNRNIVAGLSILLKQYVEKHSRWDHHLQWLTFSLNNSVHEATGTSPASIFLGRELTRPLDNLWNVAKLISPERVPSPEEVSQALDASQARRKRYYDRRHPASHQFQPGQLVLQRVITPTVPGDEGKKFTPKWSTPRRIIRFTTPVSVELQDERTGQQFRTHVQHLRKFYSRS